MVTKTTTLILLSALVAALAACTSAGKDDNVEPNIFPSAYKKDILDTMTRDLIDPTNVRDAFITDPVLAAGNKDQRYTVCVRYNPRDFNRDYSGNTVRIGYFYGGRLNQLVEPSSGQCAKAVYKPFPELEKLCYGKTCE